MLDLTIELEDGTTLGLYHLRAMQRVQSGHAKISRDAALHAAYPYIDLVRTDAITGMRRFTGMTLAQFIHDHQTRDPSGVDELMRALELCATDLRIIVRGLADPSTSRALIQWPRVPFVSSLAREIARRGPSRASTQHWRAFISGLGGTGIRGDEVKWSGLAKRLDGVSADSVITRDSILDLVDLACAAPRVVNEVRVGYFSSAGWRHCHEPLTPKEIRRARLSEMPPAPRYTTWFRHRALGWRAIHVEHHDLFANTEEPWIVLDHRGRRALGLNVAFASSARACEWAESSMAREFASWPTRKQRHRWAEVAASGGDAYEEALFQLDDYVEDFWSHHFIPVRNVLLHVRSSLQTSCDGKRLLFLDEVQSDWHRTLSTYRVVTFGGEIPDAPFHKEWPLLALKVMVWRAQALDCDGIAISTGELQLRRWEGYRPPTGLYDQTLVHEARKLSRLLGAEVGRTTIEFANSNPPESAEAGAATVPETPAPQACTVPVVWIGAVPQVRAIPLFGLGRRDDWFGAPAEASIRTSSPMQIRSRIARIRAE